MARRKRMWDIDLAVIEVKLEPRGEPSPEWDRLWNRLLDGDLLDKLLGADSSNDQSTLPASTPCPPH